MDAVKLIISAALVVLVLGVGPATARDKTRRVENRVAGYTVALPVGWHMAVSRSDGTARIASYSVDASANPYSVHPPGGQSWIWLSDGGPLWSLPQSRARRVPSLPASIPAPESYEVFGLSRRLSFRQDGHEFLAFVKGRPTKTVLQILGSIRLTARGRALAIVHTVRVIGRSVEGRPIRGWRIGNPRSHRHVLVVGCIHGNECAGMAITQRLVNLARPIAFDLWVVQDLNPDGLAADTRQNARRVDLNRNFGSQWKRIGRPGSFAYSGPRPWSEPETRTARSLVRRIHPQVTIWYHQPQALVRAWGPSIRVARRYARLARVPFHAIPWPNGTAPNWQNHLGEVSFVVELPPGQLSAPAADRYANAILRLLG